MQPEAGVCPQHHRMEVNWDNKANRPWVAPALKTMGAWGSGVGGEEARTPQLIGAVLRLSPGTGDSDRFGSPLLPLDLTVSRGTTGWEL